MKKDDLLELLKRVWNHEDSAADALEFILHEATQISRNDGELSRLDIFEK